MCCVQPFCNTIRIKIDTGLPQGKTLLGGLFGFLIIFDKSAANSECLYTVYKKTTGSTLYQGCGGVMQYNIQTFGKGGECVGLKIEKCILAILLLITF